LSAKGEFLLITGIKIPYYNIANQHIERRGVSHGIRLKHWRAVGHVFNTFAIESMVDQMAADAGMDPIEFRIQKMAMIPKARKCFETVAQMCDWKAPRPEGRALGISISERSGSLGAGVVEVSLNRQTGKIKVHKVWVAVDGGVIVQPGPAKANVESAIIYELSSILHERVSMKDGVVEQSNFHDYNVMRMSDLPEDMQVQFVDVDTRPNGAWRDRQPVHCGCHLQCRVQADRQAAAASAVHAGPRAGDAEGLKPNGIKRQAPASRRALSFRTVSKKANGPPIVRRARL
jgi:isoquinoline 1-oxidoreductase subunit beta